MQKFAQITRPENANDGAHGLHAALIASVHVEADARPLLTFSNAKTEKGELLITDKAPNGVLTGILYMMPERSSGFGNVCASASEGCKATCLVYAGRAAFQPNVNEGRQRKTALYFEKRAVFFATLRRDIVKLERKAKKLNMLAAVRINGTSDLPALALALAAEFPAVQFYDYTAHAKAHTRTRANYHLTFSRKETNDAQSAEALENGLNVAVVFDTARVRDLPETFNGFPVIDGDKHDARFLDVETSVIIGLRAKGKARKDVHGFVIKTDGCAHVETESAPVYRAALVRLENARLARGLSRLARAVFTGSTRAQAARV